MLKKISESPSLSTNHERRFNFILLVSSVLLFIAALVFALYILFWRDEGAVVKPADTTSTAQTYKYFSKLTGLPVSEESEISPRVAAIMIDNNPEGYPVSGINEALIVYEAPVEGGFSRFMAIYTENSSAEKVGPVRSARPYYLDWSAEYGDSLYMHCGGSAEGLNEIEERGIFDANEFYRGSYFWRDNYRSAPYNLYTSAERWKKYFADHGNSRPPQEWSGWNFGNLNSTSSEPANEINVEYVKKLAVGWRYSTTTQKYIRLLNGEEYLDDSNNQVTADNVIIQFAFVSVIDEVGRRKVVTTGEGEARVLRDGQLIRGTWKKEKLDSRTRFYDRDNREINLAPGRTWVMVVPNNTTLTVVN